MISFLNQEGGDEEEVFCLVHAVSSEEWGVVRSYDLVEGGSEVPVTAANKEAYVELYTRHLLLDSVHGPVKAFCAGFALVANREGFLQVSRLFFLLYSTLFNILSSHIGNHGTPNTSPNSLYPLVNSL